MISDEVIDTTDVLIEGTLTLEPQIEAEYRKTWCQNRILSHGQ